MTQTILKLLDISLFHKITILSTSTPCLFSRYLISLAFIWSQFQLLMLFARTLLSCLFENKTSLTVYWIEKYLFSMNLFDYQNSPKLTLTMLILTLIYLIIPTLTLAYLIYALKHKTEASNFALKVWKCFLDIHSSVIFYPLHLNASQLIVHLTNKNPSRDQSLSNLITIFAFIVLIYNLILSFASTALFHANLKTKNLFSSKSNTLSITDLFIKALLPFFVYKDSIPIGGKIVLVIIISLYCLFKDHHILKILPYYQVNALKIASTAHAVTTSLVLAALFAKIFCEVHDWKQESVTVLLWTVFGPIMIKAYASHIHNKLLQIIRHPFDVRNAYHVVHYWEVYKCFSKFGATGLADSRIKQEYFDLMSIVGYSETSDRQEPSWNREAHNAQKKVFLERKIELLKEYIRKYPKSSWLAELTLANIYAKQNSFSVLASHIINRNMTSKNFLTKTSLLLIKLKILNKLFQSQRSNDEKEVLEISQFLQLQYQYKELRKEMIESVDYHHKFWKVFASPKPNFLKMLQLAKRNVIISKKFKSISNQCKDFRKFLFSEPLLTCSLYCHFFQDSALLASNFLREYFEAEERLKEMTEKSQKSSLNIRLSSDTVFLIISCEQNKLGEILDCSGQIGSVLGYPKEFLIGNSISLLRPPVYSKCQDYFLQGLNETRPISLLLQEGYVKSGMINISLTYLKDYDLCYYVVIEAIKDDSRLVLMNIDGTISSCSKSFATDLGFSQFKDQDLFNIQDLCQNFFEEVNSEEEDPQEISFLPIWYKDHLVNPLIYQAKLRKISLQNTNFYEVKMSKISNFSLPLPIIDYNILTKSKSHSAKLKIDPEEIPLSSSSHIEGSSSCNKKPSQDTLFSPRSPTAQNLLSVRSPKANPDSHTAITTTFAMMTTEAPIYRHQILTPPDGDNDDSYDNNQQDEQIPSLNHQNLDENLSNLCKEQKANHNSLDIGEEILEDLFGNNSSTDTGIDKLENAKSIERQKIVKRLVKARTRRTETKLYIFSFGLVCIFLLTLLIWLNIHTSGTSRDVGTYSDALQNAYFRSYWTNIANQDTLYWLGSLIDWVDYDPQILTDAGILSFQKMSLYNDLLEESVSFLSPELLNMHYEKTVPVYDRDVDSNKELILYDNTFIASNRIIARGIANYHLFTTGFDFGRKINLFPETHPIPQLRIILHVNRNHKIHERVNRDSYFILDNSLNDLQIQADKLISAIKTQLFDIFETSRHTMMKYIAVTFVIVLLFMIFSLKYIITTNLKFKRFMTMMYILRKPDIQHIEHVSSTFKELLEKDSQEKDAFFSLYETERLLQSNAQKSKIQENNTKKNRRENYFTPSLQPALKKVYARNFLLFLGLSVFTGLTVGFTMIYYSQSSNKLDIMQKQQENISSALLFVNSISWIAVEILLIPLFNFALPTENKPVYESILEDIEQLKDINTLQNSLRNNDGTFSPDMQTILFNFNCEDSYSPYYNYPLDVLKVTCEEISNGMNYVGLLEITSRLGMMLSADIPALYEGPRDHADLYTFYNNLYNQYTKLIDQEFILLLSAYSVAIEEFEDLVDELEVSQVKLAWIAVTFSVLLGAFTWIFIMRKVAKLDFESREMMSFVSTRLLMKNHQLKRYLVQTAKSDDTMALSLLR